MTFFRFGRSTALLRALVAGAGLLPWGLHVFGPMAQGLRPAFSPLCHQLQERSLVWLHMPMVVCSRCAGIYLGMALGALLPPFPWVFARGRLLVLAAGSAMVLDVIAQDLGFHAPRHDLRLLTGCLVGWSATAFLFAALQRSPSLSDTDTHVRSVN